MSNEKKQDFLIRLFFTRRFTYLDIVIIVFFISIANTYGWLAFVGMVFSLFVSTLIESTLGD